MSKLKVIDVDKMADVRSLSGQFYRKSEADKVIADLEESHKKEVEQLLMEIVKLKQKINEAQTELELWRDGSIISEAHQKELDGKRHSDYKRCLAMVEMLEHICPITIRKAKWKGKWHMRWLELAEQFKEVK